VKYKRVIVSKFGGPENLVGEVRVKILTAGVSLADILMREGVHIESLFRRTPFSLGWDIVGTIQVS
jgi:NADPH:quinone reductase-like Zn-dependent oxidoreductase